MFDFIKRLFKKEETTNTIVESPVVVHADVGETIVIKEVALADIKKKPAKPRGVKSAKEQPAVDNVIPLVHLKVKKTSKPKVEKPAANDEVKLSVVTSPKPKGRPKKTPTK